MPNHSLSPTGFDLFLEQAKLRISAMLAVLGYSACRVGELVKLRVRDFRTSGEHRVLNVTGKGNKERTTPLHMEAVEKQLAIAGYNELL